MKITKIPGLGRFGVFIDDLDFENLTDEEWMKIGQLHLETLVTIIRKVNITPKAYENWILKWGTNQVLENYRISKKHNVSHMGHVYARSKVNGVKVDPKDQEWISNVVNLLAIEEAGSKTAMLRVSGKKDANGKPLGMFQEGELLWHSNESGNLCFAPGVALLGYSGVVGSATGFLTTPDWYEEQTESFRSELDEMIIEHKFTPGKINPGLRKEQDEIMYRIMCPEDAELPLVIRSPLGIKGLHYSINTVSSIKGMTQSDSDKLLDYINKTLFVDKYIYDHWYQQDNDICLFDNSITLHRRLGGIADRMCYRIQYDYDKIAPSDVNRYFQEPFASEYTETVADIKKVLVYK